MPMSVRLDVPRGMVPDMDDWPGVESREARVALLRDLALGVDYWRESVRVGLDGRETPDERTNQALRVLRDAGTDSDALVTVVEWALSGLTHTALVTMDGGFSECPTLDLRDPHGRSLGEALHEEWPDFDPREQP
jgi:hypothetical protein